MKVQLVALLGAVAMVAACSGGGDEITSDEQAQLNEAANMVETTDASPDSMTVTDETGLGNDEEAQTGDVLVSGNDTANAQ